MSADEPGTTRAPRRGPRLVRAYKEGWPRHAVHALILWKLERGLFRILGQGVDRLREELDRDATGLLFLANHSSWWDFFLAHSLNTALPVDGYGMTEHANMQKYGFFRRIGAFSVDRTDPGGVRASLDYTIELLGRPRAGVWFFPQGKIVCNDVRPLDFQPGLRALLGRAGRLKVVPTAIRYEFWQDERPEACVRFGTPVLLERAQKASVLESMRERLTAELDTLKIDALSQEADRFEVLFRGKTSINDGYAAIAQRLLGRRYPGSNPDDASSRR